MIRRGLWLAGRLVRAVHSALCTRVLLNLRRVDAMAHQSPSNLDLTLGSTLVFNQQLLTSCEHSSPDSLGLGELNDNAGDEDRPSEDNFLDNGEGVAGVEDVQVEA